MIKCVSTKESCNPVNKLHFNSLTTSYPKLNRNSPVMKQMLVILSSRGDTIIADHCMIMHNKISVIAIVITPDDNSDKGL
jgi:hypothetical protein